MKKLLIFLFSMCCATLSTHAFWDMHARDVDENVHARSSEVMHKSSTQSAHMANGQMSNGHAISPKRFMTEANFRYFRPSSCILREIYGKSWIDYQVKFSGSLLARNEFWNRLHVWFAINYAGNSGKSLNGFEKTKIQLVPLSFGLRFIGTSALGNGSTEYYLGTGLKYYFMEIQNNSQFVEPCVSRSKLGGVAEAGVYYLLGEHVALNFMMDYSFIRFGCSKKSCIENVQRFPLKAGGLAIGGGIGFRF